MKSHASKAAGNTQWTIDKPPISPPIPYLITYWQRKNHLGALIAFHEHRTFANAVLMGINPFDQFGVELGKQIANKIAAGAESFDASTEALLSAAGLSRRGLPSLSVPDRDAERQISPAGVN